MINKTEGVMKNEGLDLYGEALVVKVVRVEVVVAVVA